MMMMTRPLLGLEKGRYYNFKCKCKEPNKMLETKSGGGIGERMIVKCETCKTTKDITDYGLW